MVELSTAVDGKRRVRPTLVVAERHTVAADRVEIREHRPGRPRQRPELVPRDRRRTVREPPRLERFGERLKRRGLSTILNPERAGRQYPGLLLLLHFHVAFLLHCFLLTGDCWSGPQLDARRRVGAEGGHGHVFQLLHGLDRPQVSVPALLADLEPEARAVDVLAADRLAHVLPERAVRQVDPRSAVRAARRRAATCRSSCGRGLGWGRGSAAPAHRRPVRLRTPRGSRPPLVRWYSRRLYSCEPRLKPLTSAMSTRTFGRRLKIARSG